MPDMSVWVGVRLSVDLALKRFGDRREMRIKEVCVDCNRKNSEGKPFCAQCNKDLQYPVVIEKGAANAAQLSNHPRILPNSLQVILLNTTGDPNIDEVVIGRPLAANTNSEGFDLVAEVTVTDIGGFMTRVLTDLKLAGLTEPAELNVHLLSIGKNPVRR